jgi:valyl-tRNA synthetase
MDKAYEAQKFEDQIYSEWLNSGYFDPDNLPNRNGKNFSIVLPPPNVTGQLHIGHAAMLAYQDLMIRYHRMKSDKTLWLPGMDHAAIATQTVVDKKLKAQGIDRYEIGREKFLKEIDKFVQESKTVIKKQLQKMGSSLDWSRERYTMDKGLTKTVQKVFIDMYHDNLIYRGKRVVNWCPHCQSTLADDEVEHQEQNSYLYYFKYDDHFPITIATSRPETKLGDTAVAVNPKDPRYKKYIGQTLKANFCGIKLNLKIIADRNIDMNFGTGALGVTPAHSMIDYEMAQENNLEIKEVINKDGNIKEGFGKFSELKAKVASQKIIEKLTKNNLLEKTEEYQNNLSICYRCGTPIEPLPSEQWFVDVNKPIKKRKNKTLKQLASEIVKQGEIEIIPERFNKIYFQWIDNLKDWCISRQIWFGHQIPVWYKEKEIKVQVENPGKNWVQDPDTLDTWFSSGLWTFSALGGPEKTKDLKEFHPNSVMETGYDILFFWVARMILMTTYVLNEKPFEKVYLHGLVRDQQGRKMSKSLGNGIDPLEMIDKYGADALRLSMIVGSTPGTDMKLYDEKIAGYRNFINKLWNISRFILTNIEKPYVVEKKPKAQTLADKWILNQLEQIIFNTTDKIEKFQFSPAGEELYDFTWNKLADWYLEIAKIEKNKDDILLYILQNLLKLWHPFTPYITEVIWKNLSSDLLLIQKWPEVKKYKEDKKIQEEFQIIKSIIIEIRKFKNEHKLDPGKFMECLIISKKYNDLINEQSLIIEKLARVKHLEKQEKLKTEIHLLHIKIYLKVDISKSNDKEISNLKNYIKSLKIKLENKKFINNAPVEIVDQEKKKLVEAEELLKKMTK